VTAISIDGQAATASVKYVVIIRPPTASVSVLHSIGATALVIVACRGNPGLRCAGSMTARAHVRKSGKPASRQRLKRKTVEVIVATGSFAVTSGKSTTITLRLNKIGRALLTHLYRLPATLSIAGTTSLSRLLTFSYRRLYLSPAYQWAFSRTFAFATQLTLAGLPAKAHVALVCRGGGCPFAKKSFAAPKHGELALAPALGHQRLSVGATVDLEITAANTVGEVVRFTVLSNKLPKESFLCMPPGTRTPVACTT
jgi:hypothetical protein